MNELDFPKPKTAVIPSAGSRLRALADSLDCLTEQDFMLLTDTTEGTVEAWRKRGKGPDYILIGNRFLYSRQAVAAFLSASTRQRNSTLDTEQP